MQTLASALEQIKPAMETMSSSILASLSEQSKDFLLENQQLAEAIFREIRAASCSAPVLPSASVAVSAAVTPPQRHTELEATPSAAAAPPPPPLPVTTTTTTSTPSDCHQDAPTPHQDEWVPVRSKKQEREARQQLKGDSAATKAATQQPFPPLRSTAAPQPLATPPKPMPSATHQILPASQLKVGEVYKGLVSKVITQGCFVTCYALEGLVKYDKDGLLRVSQTKRAARSIALGDVLRVRVEAVSTSSNGTTKVEISCC
jgi:hypothetical protein